MLMVIFGAGASYDSYLGLGTSAARHSYWERPPLAKELFQDVARFRQISASYPECQGLFHRLAGETPVEEVLQEIQSEADGGDEHRARQVMAIRFYLRDLITDCENAWRNRTHGVTNYKALFDEIRRVMPMAVVTFNYDTMIEEALRDFYFSPQRIIEYVNGQSFSLFKLHGSVNWSTFLTWTGADVEKPNGNPSPSEMIRLAPQFSSTDDIRVLSEPVPGPFPVPAIAIPTINKSSFVCPATHVMHLETILPRISKLLIIGWQGAEQHFTRMLVKGLHQNLRVTAVCGELKDAEKTLQNLKSASLAAKSMDADPGGFSDFVRSGRVQGFLSET